MSTKPKPRKMDRRSKEPQQRMTHLAHQAARPAQESLLHDDVQEMLPHYITTEQHGENARAAFPMIAQHLDMCRQCHNTYLQLRAALNMPKPNALAASPVSPTPAAWLQVALSARGKYPARTEFRFSPRYLQTCWQSQAASAPARGRDVVRDQLLLMQDWLPLEKQHVAIQAWMIPLYKGGKFHLRLVLTAPKPLTRPHCVRLRWGKRRYKTELVAGQAEFEDISAADFSLYGEDERSGDFALSIEPLAAK
ncbi:MAG: hypothetical protein HY741_16395 [Chloroflexi bacterium]|nr:hypothetical protein [Chloroflexota bacterium]